MNIGITCYPTYGGSGAVATELGISERAILKALAEFRKQVGERQPKLAVETSLMAIDGTIDMIG